MGIVAFAVLLILTQMLRAGLGPAVTVLMQPDAPVDVVQRTICLYVETASGKPRAQTTSDGDGAMRIRMELFSPVNDASSGAPLKGSMALFFLWRAIEGALAPDATPWGAIWESFRLDLAAYAETLPLFETEKGVKIAAQVVVLTIDTLASPFFAAPTDAWSALLAQMRAGTAEMQALAPLLEAAIRGAGLSDLESLASSLGVSDATLTALGLNPPAVSMPLPAAEQADAQTAAIADLLAGNVPS
jgi:hypothetical protein